MWAYVGVEVCQKVYPLQRREEDIRGGPAEKNSKELGQRESERESVAETGATRMKCAGLVVAFGLFRPVLHYVSDGTKLFWLRKVAALVEESGWFGGGEWLFWGDAPVSGKVHRCVAAPVCDARRRQQEDEQRDPAEREREREREHGRCLCQKHPCGIALWCAVGLCQACEQACEQASFATRGGRKQMTKRRAKVLLRRLRVHIELCKIDPCQLTRARSCSAGSSRTPSA